MTNPWNESDQPADDNPWGQARNNPWDQPQEQAPPTAGWATADWGAPQEPHEDTDDLRNAAFVTSPPPPPQKKNRAGAILAGFVIFLALVTIAAVAWLFLSGRLGTEEPSRGDDSVAPVVETSEVAEESTEESAEAEEENGDVTQDSVAAQPSEVSASRVDSSETRRVERLPQAQPVEPSLPAAAEQEGLTLSGWSDNAATRCSGSEELVYAGRASDAWITVCESNGVMTYRSDIFDGTLTDTVDSGRSNPSQGEFYIDADPSIIRVVGGGVEVYQGGSLVADKQLPSAWVLD